MLSTRFYQEFFFSSVYINWNNPGSNKFKATWKKVASKNLFSLKLGCVLFIGVLLPDTNTILRLDLKLLSCVLLLRADGVKRRGCEYVQRFHGHGETYKEVVRKLYP